MESTCRLDYTEAKCFEFVRDCICIDTRQLIEHALLVDFVSFALNISLLVRSILAWRRTLMIPWNMLGYNIRRPKVHEARFSACCVLWMMFGVAGKSSTAIYDDYFDILHCHGSHDGLDDGKIFSCLHRSLFFFFFLYIFFLTISFTMLYHFSFWAGECTWSRPHTEPCALHFGLN